MTQPRQPPAPERVSERYEYFRETIKDYELIDRLTEHGRQGIRLHSVLQAVSMAESPGYTSGWDVLLERAVKEPPTDGD